MTVEEVGEKGEPRLRLIVSQEEAARWQNGVPVFLLQHMGGAAADSIQVDPVKSPFYSDFMVCFEPVTRLENGAVELAAQLKKATDVRTHADWAKEFFDANGAGTEAVNYPVHVRFVWNGKQGERWMNLLWVTKKRSLRGVFSQEKT
ncbi:MAG TPA: hypothetical protein VK716_13705 [Terracidiphilus sp.]|jgi:hypothetical protein|nr:hypothetical protein [Terracidiphilus sp.]